MKIPVRGIRSSFQMVKMDMWCMEQMGRPASEVFIDDMVRAGFNIELVKITEGE